MYLSRVKGKKSLYVHGLNQWSLKTHFNMSLVKATWETGERKLTNGKRNGRQVRYFMECQSIPIYIHSSVSVSSFQNRNMWVQHELFPVSHFHEFPKVLRNKKIKYFKLSLFRVYYKKSVILHSESSCKIVCTNRLLILQLIWRRQLMLQVAMSILWVLILLSS